MLFLSRRRDPRTACSEGGHTPEHPGSVSPSRLSTRGGERPQPLLSRARVLKGSLRVARLAAPPPRPVTLPVEWGEMGRIALPLARTEFFRSLRLRPPFHNVLNFPYAPQSRLQHRLSELEKPFKAPQSKLPCAPVDAQGVGSVGRIILNCYQQFTRHPTPAAQPAPCPPEAKQVSCKANYVKCKTNAGRKNKGGVGWDAVI